MEIRPVQPADLGDLVDIDGTIESGQYLHVDRSGEGLSVTWKVDERPLRERRIDPNRLGDEPQFLLKQIVTGADEGAALLAEHDEMKVALLLAQADPALDVMRLLDLRVDFDHRRQGLATAMLYQLIAAAREAELRAVVTETRTDNVPAARFLSKCGFDLTGLDTHRRSNHDLVKEAVTLHWYAALD
jgi:ribosomal protein S18 acetylase RimI-like enzyme